MNLHVAIIGRPVLQVNRNDWSHIRTNKSAVCAADYRGSLISWSPGISDHSAVLCELNLRHVKVTDAGARRIYSYKKANTLKITEALDRYYNILETLSDTSDVDDLWEQFKWKLFELRHQYVPSWLMSTRRRKSKLWFTRDIQRLTRKRQHAYNKFKKKPNAEAKEKLLILTAKMNDAIKKAKVNYFETLKMRIKDRPKELWQVFKKEKWKRRSNHNDY